MDDDHEYMHQFQWTEAGKRRILALSVFIGVVAYKCMTHVANKQLGSVNRVLAEYEIKERSD